MNSALPYAQQERDAAEEEAGEEEQMLMHEGMRQFFPMSFGECTLQLSTLYIVLQQETPHREFVGHKTCTRQVAQCTCHMYTCWNVQGNKRSK
jgi:hypothetical protein